LKRRKSRTSCFSPAAITVVVIPKRQ
jgi:hypothetical protein